MTKVVRVELVTCFLICQWNVGCQTTKGIDWPVYQRLQTLQYGLIQNKNLNKYVNLSEYSTKDNKAFIDDRTRVKRSYDTERCIKDWRTIQEASNDDKSEWAKQLLGAWGKAASVEIERDYGNFDRCHGLEAHNAINIEPQYCLASIDTTKSNVEKLVPTWATVGVCIPNSCAPSLIATILNDYLDSKGTIQINIGAISCRFKNDNTTIFFSYKIFIAFLATVIGLVIFSSIYDIAYTAREAPKNSVLLAFSAYTNGKNLLACKSSQSPNIMPCLDGIRAIAALWIVADHFEYFAFKLIDNPHDRLDSVDLLLRIFVAGRFSVDTFFVLSSMLAAIKMLHELSTNDGLNVPLLYVQRILRLSPVLIVIAFFNLYLIQFCANGPAYNEIIDEIKGRCEYSPWPSLLYYSNYFVHECVHGSWYLATDMHLYLVTPFLVMLLQRYPKRFMYVSSMIISIDFFILALQNNPFGLESYYTVQARISPWLIGVIFAYILLKLRAKKHIQIPKYLNLPLLTLSLSILMYLLYAIVTPNGPAYILWKGRVWWSISLCYIIFACINGQGGIVNWILSHPSWQPISRLSFNIYLIHQTIMEIIYANRKVAWHLSVFTQVQELLLVLVISCAVAVLLALTIEMPITKLSAIYLSKRKK